MAEFPRPIPQPDRDTAPFWEAQNKHELKFQKCTRCRTVRYLVGPLCPECRSFDFEWITSSGRGTIYSYTIVRHQTHPAFPVPYTMLLVEIGAVVIPAGSAPPSSTGTLTFTTVCGVIGPARTRSIARRACRAESCQGMFCQSPTCWLTAIAGTPMNAASRAAATVPE